MDPHPLHDPAVHDAGWQLAQSRRAAERFALLAGLAAGRSERAPRSRVVTARFRHALALRLRATARLIDVT